MIRLSGYSEDEIEIIETGIRPGKNYMKNYCWIRKEMMKQFMRKSL